MDLLETLQRLSALSGPSGHIGAVSDAAEALLRPLVDEVHRDRLDNVYGLRRCGRENAPCVLLDAHLDEIGFLVTGHEDGFLRFRTVGGVDARMLPGRELTLMSDEPGFGVVAAKAPHVLSEQEREQALEIENLYIDVGMSQEEAMRAYPIGTPAVYREQCLPMQGSRVSGKAMDDRACFVVLLRTLELLAGEKLSFDVCVLGSNMEETGGDGATVGAFRVHPDCAVALDVTFATQPDVSKRKGFALGGGPAIGVGPNMASWMTERFKRAAAAKNIPVNLEVMSGRSGTNGEEIQISREGVATQVLSVPVRYMHTPMEEIDLNDMEQTAQLLAAFLLGLREEEPECFRC